VKNALDVQDPNTIGASDRVVEIIEGNIAGIIVAKDTAAMSSRQIQDLKC
jgi:hypothetical protein